MPDYQRQTVTLWTNQLVFPTVLGSSIAKPENLFSAAATYRTLEAPMAATSSHGGAIAYQSLPLCVSL